MSIGLEAGPAVEWHRGEHASDTSTSLHGFHPNDTLSFFGHFTASTTASVQSAVCSGFLYCGEIISLEK
jgi:hypothetical protein